MYKENRKGTKIDPYGMSRLTLARLDTTLMTVN